MAGRIAAPSTTGMILDVPIDATIERVYMRSTLLPHALNREFPELADTISSLKQSDEHFARLLEQHDAVDDEITKSETGQTFLDEVSAEKLKKQRLNLKDQIYRIATS